MKPPRPRSTRPAKGAAAKHRTGATRSPQIPTRWQWHFETLSRLREELLAKRGAHLSAGAEPIERHSMHQADSATDEFDHELALSQLAAEQDALYEVDAAMKRILDGGYSVCEETGKPIPAARLRAVPWTRYCEEVEQRLEDRGVVTRPHLGKLRSVQGQAAPALAESIQAIEEAEPIEPAVEPAPESSDATPEEK